MRAGFLSERLERRGRPLGEPVAQYSRPLPSSRSPPLGKLKDMGNSILGRFGMSLDNFKAEKDPITGSYNISFGQ